MDAAHHFDEGLDFHHISTQATFKTPPFPWNHTQTLSITVQALSTYMYVW